ncbi:MAG: hypothetical protein ACM3W4_06105 [Ignavibacteriales bacterium]
MPRKDRLDKERRHDPDFNAAVLEAIADARCRKKNRRKLARAGRNAAWSAAEGAVPRNLDPELRGDVVGELSLMICEGRVAVDGDLASAWKRCRTVVSGHRWKELSLDAPLRGTERLTRLDLIDSEATRA